MDSAQQDIGKSARSVRRDPVFLFMIGAMLLAMGSALALRAVVGTAPAPAYARDAPTDTDMPSMTYMPPITMSHARLVSAAK